MRGVKEDTINKLASQESKPEGRKEWRASGCGMRLFGLRVHGAQCGNLGSIYGLCPEDRHPNAQSSEKEVCLGTSSHGASCSPVAIIIC